MDAFFQNLWGEKANLQHLRVLCVRDFVHTKVHTTKLESKSWVRLFVGNSTNKKASRVYNPATRRVLGTMSARLLETPSRPLDNPSYDTEDEVLNLYNSNSHFLRDLRGYTAKVDINTINPSEHIIIDGLVVIIPRMEPLLATIRDNAVQDQVLANVPGKPSTDIAPRHRCSEGMLRVDLYRLSSA